MKITNEKYDHTDEIVETNMKIDRNIPSHKKKIAYWFNREKPKFIYIMASPVISIKTTNIQNERASFTLVDFIWFSCS